MTITVTPLSTTRVLIVQEPALIARILYGRTASSRLAIRQQHGWIYQGSGCWVGLDLESEIDDAFERERQQQN